MSAGKLRVLIVEDSLTVRKHWASVLRADPDIDVIAEAADGKAAIELCERLRPDVVTMDLMLPVMSGLAATEYIMAHCPTPILIVSSSSNRGELFKTYDALAAGAVDVLEKPRGDELDGAWEASFVSTLKLVGRIRVITHPRARLRALREGAGGSVPPAAESAPAPERAPGAVPRLVALGASTGGPAAVVEILKALPADFSLPILVAIHIGARFAASLAEWLDGQTRHRVSCARDGELIKRGSVVMAPPDHHLIVKGGYLRLNQDAERNFCRPSVDVLFESVAREYGAAAIACLLTGMGKDGAAGLRAIRQAGGRTIAQDEASSVVYGMPREAVTMNAAERVLPLAQIGAELVALSASGKP